MENIFERMYKPDVLSCLADLSNDEVFTPPEVANKMLDLLPQELFTKKETKILDPACKSGVFLREAAKRFIVGERGQFDSLQECLDWIFKNQLYGIAITELTSLLSRRSVYCSKYPNSPFSIVNFGEDDVQGKILYHRIQHNWIGVGDDKKCSWCGAKALLYERPVDLETHAYEWIHTDKPEDIWKMKFDVIVSNPPYQLSDGGGGAGKSAAPIYHFFVEKAKRLNPKYITMIIPSRWFNGGKGLDSFRNVMLNDDRLHHIVDYVDSKDCFPTVDIPGGICYFLWERDYHGKCTVTNMDKNEKSNSEDRVLNEYPTFIRNNRAVDIVKKVTAKSEKMMDTFVSSRKPFGLESNTGFDENGDIILRSSKGLGKIKRDRITMGTELLPKWKTIVSKVSFEHAGQPDKNGQMRVLSILQVLEPNSAVTESYLVAGAFNSKEEAVNLQSYLRTKFVRFLLMQMLASMNMSKSTYSFVPVQDFTKSWSDSDLYRMYALNEDEIALIEQTILPMPEDASGGDSDA